jgi:hypothetical protein
MEGVREGASPEDPRSGEGITKLVRPSAASSRSALRAFHPTKIESRSRRTTTRAAPERR